MSQLSGLVAAFFVIALLMLTPLFGCQASRSSDGKNDASRLIGSIFSPELHPGQPRPMERRPGQSS